MSFLKKNNVSVRELKERPVGLIFTDNRIDFIRIENLNPADKNKFLSDAKNMYKGYILKSECFKVAYYDYVQSQYDKVLHEAKMILHDRFMNNVMIAR